ncbi:formate-nitrate transporter [Streptococcus thermophilus ND03]|nr:formate-nitrate transporter [Streptococcus thermophilus ND03]
MSTSVGIIGADIIGAASPALSRFVFAFIFAIQIGLRSHFQRRVSHFKHDVPY